MHVCYAENCAVQCMEHICFCQTKNHTLQVWRTVYLQRSRSPRDDRSDCGHGLQFYEELPSVIGRGVEHHRWTQSARKPADHAVGGLSSERYGVSQAKFAQRLCGTAL
jgi:hypothetical protein